MNHGTVVIDHPRTLCDLHAQRETPTTHPVDAGTIAAARGGRGRVPLPPRALPLAWLGDVRGRRILCLGSSGGQLAPVLAAAGAEVTVFDLSEQHLALDRAVAAREGLRLQAVQGDMRDLQAFGHGSFDVVLHPVSNLFVPDVRPVWAECHRVLARDGVLLASFFNPVLFVAAHDPQLAEQGLMRPRYAIPYSDLDDLPVDERQARQARGEPMIYGHSLGDLIGGQLDAGFVVERFMEDWQPRPQVLIERYLPAFLATRARRIG